MSHIQRMADEGAELADRAGFGLEDFEPHLWDPSRCTVCAMLGDYGEVLPHVVLR